MARFTVTAVRRVVHRATFQVEANSLDEAWDRAEDEALLPGVEWEEVEDREHPLGVEVEDVEED